MVLLVCDSIYPQEIKNRRAWGSPIVVVGVGLLQVFFEELHNGAARVK